MNINQLVSKVLAFAASNKQGYTLNIRTLEPIKSGYVVSYKETQDSFSAIDVLYVIAHALKHDGIVGGWYNEKNNRYYFDSNKVFDNEKDAINFGKENEQLSIFNLNTGEPIWLDNQAFTPKEYDFSTFAEWLLNTANQVVKHYKGDILHDAKKIVDLKNKHLFNSQRYAPQGFSLYWGIRETGTWIYHVENTAGGFTHKDYMRGLGAKKVYHITFWYDEPKNEIITVREVDKDKL